jgi:hypothetical protein
VSMQDQCSAFKPLSLLIFIVIGRTWWIFRITTTNQEVASSSLAGRAIPYEKNQSVVNLSVVLRFAD